FTETTSYTPFHPIKASWVGLQNPAPKDWVGIFPVEGADETRIAMEWTGGHASGTLELIPNQPLKPGQYELRLYENGGWERIATSTPFSIMPLVTTITPTSKIVRNGSR